MLRMRHGWPAVVCALAVWLGCWPAPAAAQALRVELLLTDGTLEGPPASAPVLAHAVAARLDDSVTLVLPRRDGHYWLRITSEHEFGADEHRLLVLTGSRALGPVTFHSPDAAPQVVRDSRAGGSALLRRGWALPFSQGWPAGSVAYLRVGGEVTEPLRLRIADASELIRNQRNGARIGAATSTAMLVMVLAIFALWAMFRDVLYLSYAGYLLCVAAYVMVLSGDAAEIPGLAWLAHGGTTLRWALPTLAVPLQLVFSLRFLELDRVLPSAARWVRAVLWVHVALLAILLLGRELVHGWFYLVGNALLVTCAPLLLAVAAVAWRRGAAYGGYYLLGWSPLLAVVALAAAQELGLVPPGLLPAGWARTTLPLVVVLELLVLAFALGHHAIARHRLALRTRNSLELDPLTGAVDGGALQHMLGAWYRRASFGRNGYGLVLLEIEGFDALHGQRGKVFGDAVLQQALVRMRTMLRADDTIARMGGARFAIVSECRREDCEHLVERIGEGIRRRPFRIDGHDLEVDISVGLVMSKRGESISGLLQRAARAMMQARERHLLRAAFTPVPGDSPTAAA